jgi:hypothetical protein
MPEIARVWEANQKVYGADKVWKQLHRESPAWQEGTHHDTGYGCALSAGPRQSAIQG